MKTKTEPTIPLHLKYRPDDLEGVVGHEAVMKSLTSLQTSGMPHTFLFTGPSGVGKTTIGRIVAKLVNCDPHNLTEVDSARYSGVDQIRVLIDLASYPSALGESPNKVFILDECHALSKNAWQALLKATEEPPEHVYWIFCTTETDKVPPTAFTRAHAYDLKPLKWDMIADYLETVAEQEKITLDKSIIALAARKAEGSMRQGLVYLSLLNGVDNKEDAATLLDQVDENSEGPIKLARLLVKGPGAFKWNQLREELEKLTDNNPESIRLLIVNYITNAALGEKSEEKAEWFMAVLTAFGSPYNSSEKFGPLIRSFGQLLF